jgi:uncharacterized protein YggE
MDNREIVVKGIGKVSASPDLLVIDLNLEVVEPEYDKAMLVATEHLDTLRAAVVDAGHDKKSLKTTQFNVNTKYDSYRDKSNNWKQKFIGYCCTHGLRLEFNLDMKKLGDTLGAIADCPANPKFSIKFSVKDPSAVSEQLLQSAIENAKWKADVLANSAGVKLGEIKRIDYNWSEHHLYSETNYLLAEAEVDYAAAPKSLAMDIEPEDIDVSDSVTVIWSME